MLKGEMYIDVSLGRQHAPGKNLVQPLAMGVGKTKKRIIKPLDNETYGGY